ncbi:unnamed protein product [Strongylus vulgaris]|uniref:Uncharacterized protein n=1 Tax=Strongylus vulgaris TaxID=40348 RepID=A0A3P7J7G9_STRVU|nr:unnamed protein product [Strongylus vulgaris]
MFLFSMWVNHESSSTAHRYIQRRGASTRRPFYARISPSAAIQHNDGDDDEKKIRVECACACARATPLFDAMRVDYHFQFTVISISGEP